MRHNVMGVHMLRKFENAQRSSAKEEDYKLNIAFEPEPSAFLTGSDAMVDLQKGRYVLQCDACDELFEAKAEGWQARQVSGRSVLVCPYCASPGND